MKTSVLTSESDRNIIAIDAPPTIPLSEAIQRASAWRDLVSSLPSSASKSIGNGESPIDPGLVPPQLIFRAINIRMDDIQWLIAQHPDASSIRIYMSLPDADSPYQICGMLVPVDAQNKDMLTVASDESVSREEMMNSAATSTIYDFTQPCPSMCNPQSPLFNADNSPEPYFRYKK